MVGERLTPRKPYRIHGSDLRKIGIALFCGQSGSQDVIERRLVTDAASSSEPGELFVMHRKRQTA